MRFNKEGGLLAVTTADNGFKILANADGVRSLRGVESRSFESRRAPIDPTAVKVCHCCFFLLLFTQLLCCIFPYANYLSFQSQLSGATVAVNLPSAITKVESLDRSSPARPPSVVVC